MLPSLIIIGLVQGVSVLVSLWLGYPAPVFSKSLNHIIGSMLRWQMFSFYLSLNVDAFDEHCGGGCVWMWQRLMWNLASLKELELNDLLLEREEGLHLLDEVAFMACERLLRLRVTNATRPHCPLLHAGIFIALRDLTLSPISLDQDLILLLGSLSLSAVLLTSSYPWSVCDAYVTAWDELSIDCLGYLGVLYLYASYLTHAL